MDYIITDYGAVGDGISLSTEAIQAALDKCKDGGGRVVIPAGTFLSGSLRIWSDTEIHIQAGGVLMSSIRQEDMYDFSADFEDDNEDTGWEGGCFLCAFHEKNITISGSGRIDGRGRELFFEDDSDGLKECPLDVAKFRPRMSYLEDITDLVIKDVTFYDSAFWTIHMAGCKNVLIENVKILNNERGPNNDGIDPDCCENVIIRGCIIRAGDDCVVLKTTLPCFKKYGPCHNIIVSDCILHSHSSALKIGTETHGDIYQVVMSDCILDMCTRGIGIWSRDGGVIHDIHVHNITGSTRGYASSTRRTEGVITWWGSGEPIFMSTCKRAGVDRIPGEIRDIYFDEIRLECEGSVTIAGEEYAHIHDVHMKGLRLKYRMLSTHLPEYIDEKPSERGIYKYKLPKIYLREAYDVMWDGKLTVDEELLDKGIFTSETNL